MREKIISFDSVFIRIYTNLSESAADIEAVKLKLKQGREFFDHEIRELHENGMEATNGEF